MREASRVAEVWRTRAPELAAWTMATLVNRRDVWGLYRPWIDRDGVEHATMTAPARKERGARRLSLGDLEAHFRGDKFRRVGLHSTSAENSSRHLAFDVDRHDDTPESAATADGNFAIVRRIVAWCRAHHYRVLVEDSNGAGGFHIWLLFDAPAPTTDVFALGASSNRDLGTSLETFPKQAAIADGRYGNWLRLPGLHHKRPHWSRILSATGEWLDGDAAIDAILRAPLNSAQLIPSAPPEPKRAPYLVERRELLDGDALTRRIESYLNKLPSRAAGQDRNAVGFRFAAFLTGDCGLSDVGALPWLKQWNARNQTPYPDSKVSSLLADARAYGQRAVGGGPSRVSA